MTQISIQEVFWKIATENRVGLLKPLSLNDFYKILEKGKNQGFSVGWRDVFPLLKLTDKKAIPEWSPPNFLIDFVVLYFKKFSGSTVLDTNVGMGVFLSALSEAISVISSTGIIDKEEKIDLVRLINSHNSVHFTVGDSIEKVEELKNEYDIVFATSVFNSSIQNKNFKINNENLTIKDTITNITALLASTKLSQNGKSVFLLPETFYKHEDFESVAGNLEEFGLYINSIISLPQNVLSPWANLSTSLFFISREKTNDLFVARLSEETEQSLLLKNLFDRKSTKFVETGRLVNFDEYKSWRQYVLQLEVREAVKSSKSPIVRLEEVALKINIADKEVMNSFEEIPNSIFLPLNEKFQTVTKFSDILSQSQNYVQVVLKPETALADYVAGYFNTDVGRKVRSSLSYGNVIAKLSRLDVMDAIVILPSMEIQQKIVESQRNISELVLGLEKLEKRLFETPYEVNKIEKQIIKLDRKESFENWIEVLPFPLASILWRYHASLEVDEKIENLLHFFEGTAQFIATVMLSAVYSDKDFFIKNKQSLFETRNLSDTIKRSTFGTWVTLGQKLSKITRNMLTSSEDIQICLSMYGTESLEFVSAISNTSLFSTLDIARKYRNDFAHGGIVNLLENKRKLSSLESELSRLRQQFATIFDDHILIKAVRNQYKEGLYINKISRITGSRQMFADNELVTTIPLDSNKLYFGSVSTKKPLEILPLINLISVAQINEYAFYFYNKVDKNQVKWITFHYEKQPEILNDDTALIKLLDFFEDFK